MQYRIAFAVWTISCSTIMAAPFDTTNGLQAREADNYATYGNYPVPKSGYVNYGDYGVKPTVVEPAKTTATASKSAGSYASYGKYPDQPPSSYSTYGSEKKAGVKERDVQDTAYANYGEYPDQPPASYKDYAAPADGYSTYGSYPAPSEKRKREAEVQKSYANYGQYAGQPPATYQDYTPPAKGYTTYGDYQGAGVKAIWRVGRQFRVSR